MAFVDLNYDSYIETALAVFDRNLLVQSMADYTAQGRQAIVCKVHGSIDWGVRMGNGPSGWHDALRDFEPRPPFDSVLNRHRNASTDWADRDGTPLYPVLTAPLAGKSHLDLCCHGDHLQALRTFLPSCTDCIVIGTSGLDGDLLAFLGDVRFDRLQTIHYVSDTGLNADMTVARMRDVLPGTNTHTFAAGFRRYLNDAQFQGLIDDLRRRAPKR